MPLTSEISTPERKTTATTISTSESLSKKYTKWPSLTEGFVLRDRFEVIKKLGEGGFGAVYMVQDLKNLENSKLALKVEWLKAKNHVLKMECYVLQKLQGKKHAVKMLGQGTESNNLECSWMLMSLVGKNLGYLKRNRPLQKFTTSTTVRLGKQCIEAIKDLHDIGIIHRDIKPSNFCIGDGPQSRTVFLLDFGLCRTFVTAHGKKRLPRKEAGFRGTERYASLSTLNYEEMGRRDDLISLMYMMVEMVFGSLPWRHAHGKQEVSLKENITFVGLFKGCPEEFYNMMHHLVNLKQQDRPNYEKLINLLNHVMLRKKYNDCDPFDWEDDLPMSLKKIVACRLEKQNDELASNSGDQIKITRKKPNKKSSVRRKYSNGLSTNTCKSRTNLSQLLTEESVSENTATIDTVSQVEICEA